MQCNDYCDMSVEFLINFPTNYKRWLKISQLTRYFVTVPLQHVDIENSYLCGYLKITGLTYEFPTLTTFFDGEIISKKYPFLTRKWEADEDVDRKHWVRVESILNLSLNSIYCD